MRQSEMKNETRQADGIDLVPLPKKKVIGGVWLFIGLMVLGAAVVLWIADLLFPIN